MVVNQGIVNQVTSDDRLNEPGTTLISCLFFFLLLLAIWWDKREREREGKGERERLRFLEWIFLWKRRNELLFETQNGLKSNFTPKRKGPVREKKSDEIQSFHYLMKMIEKNEDRKWKKEDWYNYFYWIESLYILLSCTLIIAFMKSEKLMIYEMMNEGIYWKKWTYSFSLNSRFSMQGKM